MGERYLIGSNAVIDYFGEIMPENGLAFMDDLVNSGNIILSVVTHIEVLGFQAPEDYLKRIQRFVGTAEVIPLVDSATIERTILVRRETRIKLPDSIIAATALVRNLTVVSRNEKDFGRVKGLRFLNPHTL